MTEVPLALLCKELALLDLMLGIQELNPGAGKKYNYLPEDFLVAGVRSRNLDMVQQLLKDKKELIYTVKGGYNLLHYACEVGWREGVSYIFDMAPELAERGGSKGRSNNPIRFGPQA